MARLAKMRKTAALRHLLQLGLLHCSASMPSPLDEWVHYRHWLQPEDSAKPTYRRIPRERNLTLEEYQARYEGRLPVFLEGAYHGAACLQKDWVETAVLHPFGKDSITFQGFSDGHQQQLATALDFFVSNIGKSSKNQWAYIQDEFFLLRHPELLEGCPTRPPLLKKEDHFSLLPEVLVPGDAYLLWGGKYSKSSLHVDPYNWTGTNVVLRGKKRWRLMPPGGHDRLVDAFKSTCGFALDCVKYAATGSLFVPKDKLPKGLPIWEGVALPGDVLVIPTGWWHEALNMANETIAIGSQAISRRGGSWSAVAEVLKLYSSRNQHWHWNKLPNPPSRPEELDSEAASELFRRFASSLPAEVLQAGRKKVENDKKQLEMDRTKKSSAEL